MTCSHILLNTHAYTNHVYKQSTHFYIYSKSHEHTRAHLHIHSESTHHTPMPWSVHYTSTHTSVFSPSVILCGSSHIGTGQKEVAHHFSCSILTLTTEAPLLLGRVPEVHRWVDRFLGRRKTAESEESECTGLFYSSRESKTLCHPGRLCDYWCPLAPPALGLQNSLPNWFSFFAGDWALSILSKDSTD